MMHDIGSDMHRNERYRNTNDRKEHPQYNNHTVHYIPTNGNLQQQSCCEYKFKFFLKILILSPKIHLNLLGYLIETGAKIRLREKYKLMENSSR